MPEQRTLINPLFSIPEGAEDEFQFSHDDLDSEADNEEIADDVAVDEGLAAPSQFTIINQVIKRGKGNHQSVNVVFEVDAIEGATKYEIKVTPV